jgi:hypothetical protein
MESYKNLDKLERKIGSLVFQDGIFDISLGIALIVYGIASFLYDIWPETYIIVFMLVLYAILATPAFLVQAFITKPRLGTIKYGAKRRKKKYSMIVLAGVFLVANIILFILISTGVIPPFTGNDYVIAAIFGLVPLIAFLLMAYILDFKRLYVIGPLFSMALPIRIISSVLNIELWGNIFLILWGILIIAIGALCLWRFLKKYPKAEEMEYEPKQDAR